MNVNLSEVEEMFPSHRKEKHISQLEESHTVAGEMRFPQPQMFFKV